MYRFKDVAGHFDRGVRPMIRRGVSLAPTPTTRAHCEWSVEDYRTVLRALALPPSVAARWIVPPESGRAALPRLHAVLSAAWRTAGCGR
ncbi:MAG: hypothetical protein ACRDQX_01875 [Pseudonocardiaceae bacterium]